MKQTQTAWFLVPLLAGAAGLAGLAACTREPEVIPPPPWGAPVSGGTMLVTRDGRYAVVAEPDRDRVTTVELATGTTVATAALGAGDEPGRVVEDGAGRIHVALRRGGAIVTVDPATGAILARRDACPEPRGLAWSAPDDVVHVACTDGQLVTFAAAGGDAVRRVQLDHDLRDVVVVGDQLVVTRFRTAELLTVNAQGIVTSRAVPPVVSRTAFDDNIPGLEVDATADVAWRAVALPDGRVAVSHQRRLNKVLGTGDGTGGGGYNGGCRPGPVEEALTVMEPGGEPFAVAPYVTGPLPVDLAVSAEGDLISVASAGAQAVHTYSTSALATQDVEPCPQPMAEVGWPLGEGLGAPTSVAYAPDGWLVAYYPESPALVVSQPRQADVLPRVILLDGDIGFDPGRELFHRSTFVGIACASCHPEGRDDGQVWEFDIGPRRTQSVAGSILERAPYHWAGDESDLSALVTDVFEHRMGGDATSEWERQALGAWLDQIPAPAAIRGDPAAIERGRTLFESSDVGCVGCHNGPLYTNNQIYDVGTGGAFKVPSLRGVAARAPFLHTGCAATLTDRLMNPCAGGDRHGKTSRLAPNDVADLVAFLESL